MRSLNVRGVDLVIDHYEGGAELIVFIHGVGADRTSWKYQPAFFVEHGYSVAALDMRGSGDSQARDANGIALPINLEEFARDTDAIIKALGHSNAHWIGNSMGGVIILQAISLGLDTLNKIALCNTFAYHPAQKEILPRAAAALKVKSLAEFAKERIPLVYKPDIDKATLEEGIAAMARKDPEAYLASWRATWSPDFRAMLSSITNPTLIVSGTLDQITPTALSNELAAAIPNAKHVNIGGAGHLAHADQPEEFNRILLDFLKA
jgi:pimeloyl-ACP methyl ester carboxylesterase